MRCLFNGVLNMFNIAGNVNQCVFFVQLAVFRFLLWLLYLNRDEKTYE